MTHLGERVTALVDGQLSPDVAERAYVHVAACPACREAVELERLVKQRLAALPTPAQSEDLVGSLLSIGGPAGPLPPREGHVPGSARPTPVGLDPGPGRGSRRPAAGGPGGRPAGRSDGRRGGRRTQRRLAVAIVGTLSLMGLGVAGIGLASGVPSTPAIVPPVDTFVVQHAATTSELPFGDRQIGWPTGGEGDR